MDIPEISRSLAGKDFLFFHFSPSTQNFTRKDYGGRVTVVAQGVRVEFDLPTDQIGKFAGFMSAFLFGEGKTTITHGVKDLLTFLKFKFGTHYQFDFASKIIDLKYLQLFHGEKDEIPKTFAEVVRQVSALFPSAKDVHGKIHLPLAIDVLPNLESRGSMVDMRTEKRAYLHYKIEDQRFGRLNSEVLGDDFVNLQNAGQEVREKIKPTLDHQFLVADLKAAEVGVLAVVSGDPKLLKIVDSGRDTYQTIGQLCGLQDRSKVKSSFLKYMYGAGLQLIADDVGLSLTEARDLVNSYKNYFPVAFQYLDDCQKKAESGYFTDHFGRRRFYENKPYAARNASVQGPAAIVCQEKMIMVSKMYLTAVVHDGYYFSIPNARLREAAAGITEMLEQESRMLPGLKMRTDLKAGENLGSLNDYSL